MSPEQIWWRHLRERMPAAENWAYFDHAAVAPLSGPAQKAVEEWSADAAGHGEVRWNWWRQRIESARKLVADLIGAKPNEIALVGNTTQGINLVAEGYPWQPGDNVVTLSSEFPSNLYPWMNLADRGVETRIVDTPNERLDLNRLEDLCDERTRIVSVSWVGYATGWRNDLDAVAAIAHHQGARLFVDGIQGLGVFPIDVSRTPIDFLAADGHKWLLGPEGAGVFFLREEHLELLRPIGVGWNSVQQAGNFSDKSLRLKQNAARYEGGSYNMVGFAGLAASLELLLSLGIDRLSHRVLELTDSICDRLEAAGARVASARDKLHSSGIVSVEVPGAEAAALKRRCREQAVVVNARERRLRISPHAYNSPEDIERLIAALF